MKILLAIDDSKFAEAATQTVISQVRQDHTQVHRAARGGLEQLYAESLSQSRGGTDVQRASTRIHHRGWTTKARRLVTSAAERLRSAGFEASTSVCEGDPKMVILDCATEWGSDLIIVGSHGRKGVARFVFGSVSEAVARCARCSVEIVHLPTNI